MCEVNETNAEELYFRFASAQTFPTVDANLIKSWHDAISPHWAEISNAISASCVDEVAKRFASSGLTPGVALKLTPFELAAKGGATLPDATLISFVLSLRSQPFERIYANIHSCVSDLNCVEPHDPSAGSEDASVRAIGARGAIESSDTIHNVIAFVVALFIWDDFPFVAKILADAQSENFKVAMAIDMTTVAMRVAALFCAITVSIAIQTAKSTDYTACNFLAIPAAVRYADAWIFGASWLLTCARVALEIHRSDAHWQSAIFILTHGIATLLSGVYMFILFMRVGTSASPPQKQWFRWFPFGKSRTARTTSKLLLASGRFAKKAARADLRAAIAGAVADASFSAKNFPESASPDTIDGDYII